MATVPADIERCDLVRLIGRATLDSVRLVGDTALFALSMLRWLAWHRPLKGVLFPCLYQTGVRSVPVVVVTGAFIGMVLAVQTYDQLRTMGFEATIGSVINVGLVTELGPVLAALMLAGRVGSAMAAELGTMRVTEQIDALRMLGTDPVHYLVVPRFLACFLLIPLLTMVADAAGLVGGWFFSTQVLAIPDAHYWHHAEQYVTLYDIATGIFKSGFFGAAIAVIACHRGFHCDAGAEGVGKAATEAFVYSFVMILALDLLLGIFCSSMRIVYFQTMRQWALDLG